MHNIDSKNVYAKWNNPETKADELYDWMLWNSGERHNYWDKSV